MCLQMCLQMCIQTCLQMFMLRFMPMLTLMFTQMFTYMLTHTSQNMLDRWRWHKHRLFPNARLNLSLSYIDVTTVAILHFQSGRVVRALVEPSK